MAVLSVGPRVLSAWADGDAGDQDDSMGGAPEFWQLSRPLPALWRSPGVLQLGLEEPGGLILDGVPDGLADSVTALLSPCTAEGLVRPERGMTTAWVDWLLATLGGAGLLRQAAAAPGPVMVVGEGRLAIRLAAALLAAGCDPVRLVCPGNPGTPRALRRLPAGAAARLQCVDHWQHQPIGPDGLVLLAGSAAEADRSLTGRLTAGDHPHLLVTAGDLGAVVGPLVLPGRTACLRCEDLHRAARDPAWPALLAQLCRTRPEGPPPAVAWALATATTQALAWLAGGLPDSTGAGLELGHDQLVRRRPLRAHPDCGCPAFAA